MEIINTTNLNEARKQIQKLKKENNKQEIIILAQDDEFNRKILENKDADMIIGLEYHNRKDYLKQRDSGLNEILCKLAAKNNIKIGIQLEKIKNLDKKQKAIVLARIKQNINLCKKTKTQLVFVSPTGKQEASSLFLSLGASTQQAKLALQ